jgi:xylan 1,4-beta-xylosidase
VHDSFVSAAYILTKLMAVQGLDQGMSYWTYSDLFEEPGPPPTPFHGGFGLLTREGIRKPAYFAYKYLHALQGRELPSTDGQSWASIEGRRIAALVWDWEQPEQKVSNHPYFTKIQPAPAARPARISFRHVMPGTYRLSIRRTGFRANDAYTAYLEMGAPKDLNPDQLHELQRLTRDAPERSQIVKIAADGLAKVDLPLRSNDIALLVLEPTGRQPVQ